MAVDQRDRLEHRIVAGLYALIAGVPLSGVLYDLWTHHWFAAGCFAVLALIMLLTARRIWRWGEITSGTHE